jgi:hypothetical protein
MSRKIPTVFGFVLLFILMGAVALSVSLLQKATSFLPRASSGIAPENLGVANVTDTTLAVYWFASLDSPRSVYYGRTKEAGEGVVLDEGKTALRFVTLAGLVPATKYYLTVGSRDGTALEASTGPTLAGGPAGEPIYSRVTETSGAAAAGALVLWEATGSGRIAAVTKIDGSFVLPIGNARRADLSAFFALSSGQTETITVLTESATARLVCRAGEDRPLPTIKLGESRACAAGAAGAPPPVSSPAAGLLLMPTPAGTPSAQAFHYACQNYVCALVAGTGQNTCLSNHDCAPPAAPATPAAAPTAPVVPVIPATPAAQPVPPSTGRTEDVLLLFFAGLSLIATGASLALARR